MLVRIVKLTFKPENIPSFGRIFEASKPKILEFEGCELVIGYQDMTDPCVFFTYSHWKRETDLENYRKSEFFKNVWAETKALFADKPEAWSVNEIRG
nr:antibiotic biosynthesis monooxygenase [Allomuricauda sp.]